MQSIIRMSSSLEKKIRADLSRPHQFVYERVGFVQTKDVVKGNRSITLCFDYIALEDTDYMTPEMYEGVRFGANVIGDAIMRAMETGHGQYLVHLHDFSYGVPGYSPTDNLCLPPIVKSIAKNSRNVRHGLMLFSKDKMRADYWDYKTSDLNMFDLCSIVGYPSHFTDRGRTIDYGN